MGDRIFIYNINENYLSSTKSSPATKELISQSYYL